MESKILYNRPSCQIIELEQEGVIACSDYDPQIDTDNTHEGGKSRVNRLWKND